MYDHQHPSSLSLCLKLVFKTRCVADKFQALLTDFIFDIFLFVFLVCPQQGATTITQLELVPRPKGIVKLRCDFNVPPDPTHSETGFLYIAWVIDTTRHLYSHLYDPIHVRKALCFVP